MNISKRLKTIGDLVPVSSYPLDIGCDHALLSIYLVKERKLKKVLASDNKEGPIEKAKENISFYHVEKQVDLSLKDGLSSYQKKVDVITITGMGGYTISKILKDGKKNLTTINEMILSPNNYVQLVRKNILMYGFYIDQEVLVKEKNIIYPILVTKKGKRKYSKKELFLGPYLMNHLDDLVKEYYEKEYFSRKTLWMMLPKSYIKRRYELRKEMKWLYEILKKIDILEKE